MIVLITVTIILIIVIGFVIKWSDNPSQTFISVILGMIFVGLIVSIVNMQLPSTLDVYRGNTELKITGEYKDSVFIPIDSIVIYKNN